MFVSQKDAKFASVMIKDGKFKDVIYNYGKVSLPEEEDENGNKLADIWQSMQGDWNSLGADGQKVYNDMRDVYLKQYRKLKDVLYKKID